MPTRIFSWTAITIALITALVMVFTWPERTKPSDAVGRALETLPAKVTKVENEECPVASDEQCQRAFAELENGDEATFVIGSGASDVDLQKGDRIQVVKTPEENLEVAGVSIEPYSFSDFDRRMPIMWLALLFVVVVAIGGRLRGIRALGGLALSVGVILLYIIPGLLQGDLPLVIATAGALAVMFLTIPTAHGWGLTTIAATLGTAASLLLTIALAVIFTHMAKLTGFGSDEAAYLAATTSNVSIQGLLLAGIVIATLGVLDDVTVTQASTVLALRKANSKLTYNELFSSALTVGRDHITATVNTLVLAFAGANLSALLVFAVVDIDIVRALNGEAVAGQIVGTLVGSIGLIAAVPITTSIAALMARATDPAAINEHEGHTHSHG